MNEIGLPIFLCQPMNTNPPTWRFFCPYCDGWHTHTAEAGHRAAHCYSHSPLKDGGYVLRLDTRFTTMARRSPAALSERGVIARSMNRLRDIESSLEREHIAKRIVMDLLNGVEALHGADALKALIAHIRLANKARERNAEIDRLEEIIGSDREQGATP